MLSFRGSQIPLQTKSLLIEEQSNAHGDADVYDVPR